MRIIAHVVHPKSVISKVIFFAESINRRAAVIVPALKVHLRILFVSVRCLICVIRFVGISLIGGWWQQAGSGCHFSYLHGIYMGV